MLQPEFNWTLEQTVSIALLAIFLICSFAILIVMLFHSDEVLSNPKEALVEFIKFVFSIVGLTIFTFACMYLIALVGTVFF